MAEETLHLKPVAGRRVLDPRTYAPLPAEGARVPKTPFWTRRLRDGDVEVVSDGAAETGSKRPRGRREG